MKKVMTGKTARKYNNMSIIFTTLTEMNNYTYAIGKVDSILLKDMKITKCTYQKDDKFYVELANGKDIPALYEVINFMNVFYDVMTNKNTEIKIKKKLPSMELTGDILNISLKEDNSIKHDVVFTTDGEIVGYIDVTDDTVLGVVEAEKLLEFDAIYQEIPVDVYVVPSSKENNEDAFIAGAMVKNSGYKTDIDYRDVSYDEKIERAKELNTTYVVKVEDDFSENLEVTVLDLATKEESKVMILNLIDVLEMGVDEDEECKCGHKHEY